MRLWSYSEAEVRARLDALAQAPWSYAPEGITREPRVVPGLCRDRATVGLGRGLECFERASAALRRWAQFDLGWAQICFPSTAPVVGARVAVHVSTFGLWTLNPARVLYVLEEPGLHYGYAYGTLPGHVEAGEELFLVRRDPSSERVEYAILAYSRAAHPLVRLARPLARRAQRRFAFESCRAMQRAVEGESEGAPELWRDEQEHRSLLAEA